ncbi:hypothetical protein DFAR_1810004 [Desulfarculales bacterium]
MQIIWRCNLACRHYYLGAARSVDLLVPRVMALFKEIEALHDLWVLVSGDAPVMHPAWRQVNALLAGAGVRRVLLEG